MLMKRLLAALILTLLCSPASAGCMSLLYSGKCSASGPPPLTTPAVTPQPSAAFTQSNGLGSGGGGLSVGLTPNQGVDGAFALPTSGPPITNSFAFYSEATVDPSIGGSDKWMFGYDGSAANSAQPRGVVLIPNNTIAQIAVQIDVTGSGNTSFNWWMPTVGMTASNKTMTSGIYNLGVFPWTASDG